MLQIEVNDRQSDQLPAADAGNVQQLPTIAADIRRLVKRAIWSRIGNINNDTSVKNPIVPRLQPEIRRYVQKYFQEAVSEALEQKMREQQRHDGIVGPTTEANQNSLNSNLTEKKMGAVEMEELQKGSINKNGEARLKESYSTSRDDRGHDNGGGRQTIARSVSPGYSDDPGATLAKDGDNLATDEEGCPSTTRMSAELVPPMIGETSQRRPSSITIGSKSLIMASAMEPTDANIPVIYQSIKAEIQNLLDKMTTAQFQEVAEAADRIRDQAVRLKRAPSIDDFETLDKLDLDFTYVSSKQQANDLVSQITKRRQTESHMLQNAAALGGQSDVSNLKRLLSMENQKRNIIEQQTFEQTGNEAELGLTTLNMTAANAQLYDTVRKLTKAPDEMLRNILEEAVREDHMIPFEELEEKYSTSRTRGLTEQQVSIHRQRDGLNVLKPQKITPEWLVYLKTLVAGFGIILWVAVILCIIAFILSPDPYNLVLGFVLLVVIFVQGTFSYLQQRKATNLIASFSKMMPNNCQVLRQGGWTEVPAADLVVGDIIRIGEGAKLPADIRVFEVNEAKVEKSSLTGETEPIPLSVAATDRNIYETRNMALFGTSMTEGQAVGIVVNTGERTVMGKIARMASNTKSVTTGLQKEIAYFMTVIVTLAVLMCVTVLLGYYLGIRPAHPTYMSHAVMITNCIAIVVALLPDGLPISIISMLTLVGKRLHSEMILVKKLTVTETLGSATLIASDKTGTITMNRMKLRHIWLAIETNLSRKVSLVFDDSKTEDHLEKVLSGCFNLANMGKAVAHPSIVYLLQVMSLCNKSNFENEKKDDKNKHQTRGPVVKTVIGNPTEAALLQAADSYFDVNHMRQKIPIAYEIPFNSRRKFHMTCHQVNDTVVFANSQRLIVTEKQSASFHYVAVIKGAPEYILSMCSTAIVNNEEVEINRSFVARVMHANEQLAMNGERVLAFAYKILLESEYPLGMKFDATNEKLFTTDMCFLGLTGILDPPKPGVAEAIDECHTAGVRVMMVTGDQPTTAVAISRMVNIITKPVVKTIADVNNLKVDQKKYQATSHNEKLKKYLHSAFNMPEKREFLDEAIVITGMDIPNLSKPQWDFVLSHREVVFARTTPQHKLQIVKEAQQRRDIIAVTGDGVNDAPALKAANLGVAMGISGSDVSKEAANMVLLDDNFVTIVRGIKEGRLLFDNLKKVVCYLLPAGSFSEILPVLAAVFLGMPQPLSAFLMIVICVGTDMCGSMGLVHEEAESDIMIRRPRNAKTDRLVNGKIILFTYCFIGTIESVIAFFMYFFTMWQGNVPPSKLMFAFEDWGKDFNVTINGETHLITAETQLILNNEAQTAFFVSLVMTQLWNLLSVRTRVQSSLVQKFDPRLLWYMAGEIVITLFICYLPVVNDVMATRPMKWYHFVIPASLGLVMFCLDELRKLMVRRFPNGIFKKLAW